VFALLVAASACHRNTSAASRTENGQTARTEHEVPVDRAADARASTVLDEARRALIRHARLSDLEDTSWMHPEDMETRLAEVLRNCSDRCDAESFAHATELRGRSMILARLHREGSTVPPDVSREREPQCVSKVGAMVMDFSRWGGGADTERKLVGAQRALDTLGCAAPFVRAEIWWQLGVLRARRNPSEAEAAFREALRLNPALPRQEPPTSPEAVPAFTRAEQALADEARRSNLPWTESPGPPLDSTLEDVTTRRESSASVRARAWLYRAINALQSNYPDDAADALDQALVLSPSLALEPELANAGLEALLGEARERARARTVR
jgi:hypothetical protein